MPDEHPHRFVVVSQVAPAGLPAQSAAAVHPQVFVEVLQLAPTGLAAQSALVTRRRRRDRSTCCKPLFHMGRPPAQSELDVQAGSHKKG